MPGYLHNIEAKNIVSTLNLVSSDPRYLSIIYSVLDGNTQYDLFAKHLLSFAISTNQSLSIIKNVILSEFESNTATPTSILRGNTAGSRIIGLFCRLNGCSYLHKTLAPILNAIVGNKKINFEIDGSKILGENVDETLKQNLEQLTIFAENIISLINTPQAVLEMPREIKAIAYLIHKLASQYSEENRMLLVGGFIMLRFINPALLSPEAFNLIPADALSLKDRRNLTLLCKIVQNVSNQKLCNEEWMLACNPYIEQNFSALEDFYHHIIIDPEQESADETPFEDLFVESSEEIDYRAIDIEALEFFKLIFTTKKSQILDIFSKAPHKLRVAATSLEIVELISDFGELEEEPHKLEFYYSPLCPYSRTVLLFLSMTNIPVTKYKIDLLKDDQALDQNYKKFSQLSSTLRVPLLVHDQFILEETAAICLYLSEIYYVGNLLIPYFDIKSTAVLYQILDWLHEVEEPIERLWEACKSPIPRPESFQRENFTDLLDKLEILEKMYEIEKDSYPLRDGQECIYLQGDKPTLVDVTITALLSFAHLIIGFPLHRFPTLKVVYSRFTQSFHSIWKEINFEFEGFFKYLLSTLTISNQLPVIKQLVLFEQSPHTIYEMLLDPENDIFLYLASKSISVVGNVKLKRGLKKTLGQDPKEVKEKEEEENEKAAIYNINLEVGGEFNIHGREGKNLLLVPGKKIVQESRMSEWLPVNHTAMEIFDLQLVEGTKTLMTFTEFHCPKEKIKTHEENWNKFWKKINGIRVNHLHQFICFPNKSVNQIFEILSDTKTLSKTLKCKINSPTANQTPQSGQGATGNGAGTLITLFNNKVSYKIDSLEPNQSIVEQWRFSDWPDDFYCCLRMHLTTYNDNSCKLEFLMSSIPLEKVKLVAKFWKSNFWMKLSGIICLNIRQTINFRTSSEDVCQLLMDSSALSAKLKSKSSISSSGVVLPHFKGSLVAYDKGSNIRLSLLHKEWSGHFSTVNFQFENLTTSTPGCILHLTHENIHHKFTKSLSDIWNDYWEKLDGILIDNVFSSVILFNTPTSLIYEYLLNSSKLQLITGSDCTINPEVGGNVSMYDKFVKGTITHLHPNAQIKMSLRDFNWPFSYFSEVVLKLDEINEGKATLFTFTQNHVPVNYLPEVNKRATEFCKQLVKIKFQPLSS